MSSATDAYLSRRGLAAAVVGAALAGGLAWVHPSLAIGAWIWACLTTVIALGARSRWMAFVALWLAHMSAHAIAFDWVAAMTTVSIGYTGPDAVAFAVAQYAAFGLVPAAAIALGGAALRGRLPAFLWLPLAWLVAESVRFAVLAVSIDDWLATQWQVQPVLDLLGHLGWWATAGLCLAACAGVGEAWLRRRPIYCAPAGILLAAVALAPPLPSAGEHHLAGVAAMHVQDGVTLPHRAPPADAIDLVVWPEDALHLRPRLGEGSPSGARLQPLLPDSAATHLIGLSTRSARGRSLNQAVVVAADGAVLGSRAKRLLLPVGERRFLNLLGRDAIEPGAAPTVMTVAGRPAGVLICGEVLSRALVAEAVDGGAELLLVPARDQMMISDRALRHLLAMQVLRSVEYGVPSVRAAHGGRAVFVGSDGRILARSPLGRNGFLMWDRARGARSVDFHGRPIGPGPPQPVAAPDVAVLYSLEAPHLRARCPEGRCVYHALEGFTCDAVGPSAIDAVIVSGHGRPPTWLSHDAAHVAAAVGCFEPSLVVIDTCYGASVELLTALSGRDAIVVGATSLLPAAGLRYGRVFFESRDPVARAAAVQRPGAAVVSWRTDPAELAAAVASMHTLSDAAIAARVVRRDPMSARMDLSAGAGVLVPVPIERAAAVRTAVALGAARARPRR